MEYEEIYDSYDKPGIYKISLFILVSILVFTGTYFRIRDPQAAPTLDWYVLIRVGACFLGLLLGLVLVPKGIRFGFGAKIAIVYVLATGLSAITSDYSTTVAGYFVLLLGATVLMMALVYHAEKIEQLKLIEKIWFITLSILIIKDTMTSVFFPGLASGGEVYEVQRLGTGVTHANQLSLFAGMAFWLSFRKERFLHPLVIMFLRAFFIYVIIAAISRVSISAFMAGGIFYYLTRAENYFKRMITVTIGLGFILTLFFLSLEFGQEWTRSTVIYLKRGEEEESFSTFTGRTDIWEHVYNKSFESPITGHGYGVARYTMDFRAPTGFEPSHCHNELLEVFFNTGFVGLLPFIIMILYSLKWIVKNPVLKDYFSYDLAVHGACIIAMFLTSSFFEARIAAKLLPAQPLFFFYLFALDRERDLSEYEEPDEESGKESGKESGEKYNE